MIADPRELRRLRTFYVGEPGGDDLRAAFVIDGRRYGTPEQVRVAISEAVAELHRRRLAAQFVTRPVTSDAPVPALPSWQDYRTSL